ncbi:alkylglycerol monooxygenase-like [Tachypleus tridentatus]|uniref:alkylglycerol monooxygenase-like n=1 Tax=Tachypleus tridentatus TaxID=6853 RepID=UPI003FD44850
MDGIFSLERLGYLFYIVDPRKHAFEKIEEVPQYINEVMPLFFLWYLLELVVARWKNKKYHRTNDTITSVSQGILNESTKLFIRGFQVYFYILVYDNWRLVTLPWNSVWTWLLTFFGVDFFFYWVHRFCHEINILWTIHQVHHSSEEFNITSSLRQPMFVYYVISLIYLPLALAIPPAVYFTHHELNLLYQSWLHTQVVGKLGPLEHILNTPSHHRVHHGCNKYYIDKNYAGVFIIWDRMFGTFQVEDEEVVFGLTQPIQTFNPVYIQFSACGKLLKSFWNIKGFNNKLSVLFKGPGWSPGKPRLGLKEDIPDIHGPREKYDPHLPTWCIMYLHFHSYIVAVFYIDLSLQHQVIPQAVLISGVVFCFITILSFSTIMDKRQCGPLVEGMRCFLYFYVDFYILPALGRDIKILSTVLRSVFIVCGLFWFSQLEMSFLKIHQK